VRYKVIFDRNAEREFAALSEGQRKTIFEKLKALADNPAPMESVQLEGYSPLRRIKAGDVRAIFDQPDVRGRIFVLRFGTDHDVYEDLDELIERDAPKRP
jgi:mRNA-degrading endonuclease RelE of RelBE toxin-antitoxin system